MLSAANDLIGLFTCNLCENVLL